MVQSAMRSVRGSIWNWIAASAAMGRDQAARGARWLAAAQASSRSSEARLPAADTAGDEPVAPARM